MIKGILILIAGFIVLVAAVNFTVEFIGVHCQFCVKQKLIPFKKLSVTQQQSILHYFEIYEKRMPAVNSIFVCSTCKSVFDDFSGEKRSMDIDAITCRVWCKVCNLPVYHCEHDNPAIECAHCHTRYKWFTDTNSGYIFLRPYTDKEILKTCQDNSGHL
jgi:hypothetical protein